MDMKNEIAYTVVAYNQKFLGRLVSIDVFKTNGKTTEARNYLKVTLGHRLTPIRIPFAETVEKDKTYYQDGVGGEEKAIATNRATPIEALRDALNCLTEKHPTLFEPNLLSMTMGKITSTLRRMFQEDNITNVRFFIRLDQKYFLACIDTEGNLTTTHNDFAMP